MIESVVLVIVLKLRKHRKAFYIIKTYTLKRNETPT